MIGEISIESLKSVGLVVEGSRFFDVSRVIVSNPEGKKTEIPVDSIVVFNNPCTTKETVETVFKPVGEVPEMVTRT